METKLTGVPERAKQVGETQDRWGWVEPEVWTERMLTALENGVKGGVWFSLIDKVYKMANLRRAFERVKTNGGAAGVDHQSIEEYEADVEGNLHRLAEELREGRYRPQAIRRVWIPKPGSHEQRPLGIPTVRDRVVQTALRQVIEPIFERDFAEHSYGFRPNRGCKDALRRVDGLLKDGATWIVDIDLKSYFDTISHLKLMELMTRKIADSRVLDLIAAYLNQKIVDQMASWTPETGSPQGAVISPLLSNIYLDPLDHLMAQAGYAMTRYADDMVIQCRSEAEARQALELVREWTTSVGLTLHPTKTRIVDATLPGGFDFLGYHFERGYRWPSRKSLSNFKDRIRHLTQRSPGHSFSIVIAQLNQTLRGWFEYFKHSHRTTFPRIDSWIRMRLRSILRKHQGGKGVGKGLSHFRWPNSFFHHLGLFSLVSVRDDLCQSSSR